RAMDSGSALAPILEGIPSKPGCYLMKDADGRVIYVGKAVQLRARVRSYFHASADHGRRTEEMVAHVADIEWIVVGSELEALILEMNLIKRHRPKYNVRLKDDKRYPYVKVHWGDPFPKVTVTRRMDDDGSRYFGPYTSVWAVHQTLDVLRKIFPYLTCDRVITGQDPRACLYHDIRLCLAPCIGAVDQAGYRSMVADLCAFLEGKTEEIVERLKAEMARASSAQAYERAAALRDQLWAIEKVVEGQKVVSQERVDSDVIAFARDQGDACVQVFLIRGGKLIGREYFVLEGAQQADDREVVAGFLTQYYTEAASVPERLVLPTDIEEARIIETWLRSRRAGQPVEISVPKSGPQRELVELAAENAAETLAGLRAQWAADRSKHVQALAELQQALGLPLPPNRIECYDISNLQGTAAAGSMVVFEQGAPARRLYRRFNIKTVQGQDDFASMEEVLRRRFRRWRVAREEAEKPGGKLDPGFGRLPDLLIVDGGKGQLGRAVQVVREADLSGAFGVVGLAKNHEEIYRPEESLPTILARGSAGLHLIQRIRDEAHRVALSQHQTVRRRTGMASQLDAIPGIGPARRRALLRAFGDVERIRRAPVEELMGVPGISRQMAQRVKSAL
ncbi:MAG TPA: excinuclease ABC subunit UvrC, partial [Anaerolineales bacterium]|nr:excinuclease ABC subunit UvrC [Anaerolineales bacterium]